MRCNVKRNITTVIYSRLDRLHCVEQLSVPSPQSCTAQAKAKLIKQKHAKCLWARWVLFRKAPHLQLLLQLRHSPLQHPPVLVTQNRGGGVGCGQKVMYRRGRSIKVKWSEEVVWVERRDERALTESRGGCSEADEAWETTLARMHYLSLQLQQRWTVSEALLTLLDTQKLLMLWLWP